MLKKIILFLLIGTIIGCGSSKPVIVTTKQPVNWKYSKTKQNNKQVKKESSSNAIVTSRTMTTNEVTNAYIAQYNAVAMANMKAYGIPASIILAQGILESGAGKGDLAVTANNHFGIKCHNDWTGDKVYKDDDSLQECFRKYNQASESYQDHAMVLTGKKRYSNLFTLPKGDYKAWARGLKDAGYATDPRYPEKLISYIESYNLSQFDAKVLGNKMAKEEAKVLLNDNFDADQAGLYEIQKGDTFYSVSKKFNLSVDELKQKNNLSENALSIGQKLIVK
ncbi:LysM peptidoglycan-binding domain-containing protein [Flavobacterium sp. ZT3R18]|uniref:glucosaminidase domain-containing protein n=1 Tax=Flavobacterium sp. ZT3R18 TaxID=2594429 RepID=UPI00117BA255|nr:glucosaminidase domain-containing protein [Flavobacterium sp. ZT3R18]TRX38866.1 LysM peptidoglycan-binding domain-containing protein [Flavobacterium sp. ZT3R18]